VLADVTRAVDGSSLNLHLAGGVCRFHVKGMESSQLRAALLSWVVEEAGPVTAPATAPLPIPPGVVDAADLARTSVDLASAARLGSEPVPDRATVAYRMDVAAQYRLAGNSAAAIVLLTALASEVERAFGPAHNDTLKVLSALGETRIAAGHVDGGLRVLREALATAETFHGADADLAMIVRSNLGMAYQRVGQYAHAIEVLESNLARTEQLLGRDNVTTVVRRNNLAGAVANAGHRQRAISLYWEVLDALMDIDPGHSLVRIARQNLAILHNPSWSP